MGMKELLIILVVVLVVFGARKLRSVGEDLGHAVRGFKTAMEDGEQQETAVDSRRQQIRSGIPDSEFPEVRAVPKADTAARSGRSV
jgi:sec-independent protein translocase protein TatA